MKKTILKLNKIIFWWYYDIVPNHFHKWTLLKSIKILVDNYESSKNRYEGLEEVVRNASRREREMSLQISNLTLKLKGISQDTIDPLNKIFGTDLKGLSNEEINN